MKLIQIKEFVMFKNYLKITLRNFRKYKTYSFINIFGLAAGIACCILILIYVQDELNFDTFHEKSNRIFRVVEIRSTLDQGDQHIAYTMGPLGPALVNDFPEVVDAVRFFEGWRLTVKQGEVRNIVRNYLFSEPDFFNVFDFELLQGDPNTALTEPHSIILTETTARQLFGDENPLGKILKVEDEPEFTFVKGVVLVPDKVDKQGDAIGQPARCTAFLGMIDAATERWH